MSVSIVSPGFSVAAASSAVATNSTTLAGSSTSWAQVVASTSGSTLIVAIRKQWTDILTNAQNVGIEVGVGAAGSEVSIATVPNPYTDTGHTLQVELCVPVRVPSGSRIAVRNYPATGGASGVQTLAVLTVSEGSLR